MQRALWRYDGAGDPVPCEIVERVDSGPDCRLCWAILFDDNWQSLARTDELELVL